MRQQSKYNSGFTIVEIVWVVAVVALLSAVVVAQVNSSRKVARDGARASDLGSIQLALNRYFVDNKTYPATLNSLISGGYLGVLPTDPLNTGAYTYKYAGIDTNSSAASCESYHLGAVMEGQPVSLGQDSDKAAGTACTGSAADFHGNATNCSGVSGTSPDKCFDLSPQ